MKPRTRVVMLFGAALAVCGGVIGIATESAHSAAHGGTTGGRAERAGSAHGVDRALPNETREAAGPKHSGQDANKPAERVDGEHADRGDDSNAECAVRPPRMPTGAPAALSCRDARRIVTQVRARIPVAAARPELSDFSESLVAWLDPHGLWSAAPDAPAHAAVKRLGNSIAADIERAADDTADCGAARELARTTRGWVEELRALVAVSRSHGRPMSRVRAFELVQNGIFEDDPVTRPARALARELGERFGAFEKAFGETGSTIVASAQAQLLPDLPESAWTEIVLAAAVRAYVPAVDAHGEWAPLDEEWSLYAADAAIEPGARLWSRMERSALGVHLISDAAAPLEDGDLVLEIGGVTAGGLGVEQLEQLAQLEPFGDETERSVTVLRRGAAKPERVAVPLEATAEDEAGETLDTERIAFGDGFALVVTLPDVRDSLGDDLSRLVTELGARTPPEGIVIDLRGNGGGSTDGAAGAIGVFLPGAPSFPLLRRGGSIEIGRATLPDTRGQWHGPVAVLVDGYTASAAEMIAGALASYERGVVLGTRTFGKGCVQEYFDDRAGAGVLRLTTMLFSLPDGAPLQAVGLTPSMRLPLSTPHEREATLPATPPSWRGPDIRARSAIGGAPWPAHHGHLGPCRDAQVCAALRRLGAAPSAIARHSPVRSSSRGRAAGG